ncbi:MAG: cytochrome b [Burkholderiales bacterium]|nr:cytochrome b [Burkholderiales bacterium]
MMRNTRYSQAAIAIHWLAAMLIFSAIAMGVYMTQLQMSPMRLKLYNWHKWLGVTILAVSVVRLAWRMANRPPADLPMPAWQQRAAHSAHWAMYFLFFAVPLSGWTYSSAAGFPVVVFGLLPLPDLVAPDTQLAATLKSLHIGLALSLGGIAVLHVAAVLKHQLLDRDGILSRMAPWNFRRVQT